MLIEEKACVRAHKQAAENLFFIELESPRISQELRPGQFVHMQIPGMPDRILRRPFSVYTTNPRAKTLTIFYQVVGSGTAVLSHVREGEFVSLIGPIGNMWSPPENARALLVCGGVGSAPLFMLARRLSEAGTVTVVMGAQSKKALVTLDDYAALEHCEVIPATDDGSFGFTGFCTVPAQEAIDSGRFDYVAVCGPEPLMKIVSSYAQEAGLECEVSLEQRMACGVGACLSCVVDTTSGKKRCCVDGPIFKASEVVW